MAPKLLVIGMAALVLVACATPPESGGQGPDRPMDVEQPIISPALQQRLADALEARQVGDFAGALFIYLEVMQQTERPEVAEQAARMAAAMENWPDVDEATDRWLSLDPDSAAALQLSVVSAFRQDQPDRAVERLTRIVDQESRTVIGWGQAIALMTTAPGPAEAEAALERLLEQRAPADDPGFADLQRSRLAHRQGDAERALELAEAALSRSPDEDTAMWAGQLAEQVGQVDRAVEHYRSARALAEDPLPAGLAEVELLSDSGRAGEALDTLQSLPDSIETFYARAFIEQELGNQDRAVAAWQSLADMAPALDRSEDAARNRSHHAWLTAVLADTLELEDEAVAWYEKVHGARRPRADLRRAALIGTDGRMDQARAILADIRAIEDPGLTEQAWMTEADLLLADGQDDEVIALYSNALAAIPDSTALLYARAMAAVQLDRVDLAEQDLRTIIQREDDNAIALNALGYTLSDRTDRQREALRLIERALALEPDNPAILDSMGWVLFKLDRAEEALPYLEQAANGDFHPEIVSHLIEVLWVLDRRDQAREWIDRARPRFAGESVFDQTLERLEGLQ